MKNNLLKLFPSATTATLLFALPIILAFYFIISRYSQDFITQQQINYFDVQNNWLGQVFINQEWLSWFNRFMDFAIWGVLAAVVLLGMWLFSAGRVSMQNHYAQQEFTNFRVPKNTWHTHFLVVITLKLLLVLVIIVSLFSLIAQAIPLLDTNISYMLQSFSWQKLWQVIVAGLLIVFLEYLIATCIKLFKTIHADD